ncbi:MAG: hypothetical protein U0667_12305 [Chloroflexota bacterium]
MSRPIRCSIVAIVLVPTVLGGGAALGQGAEPSGPASSGAATGSATPATPLPSDPLAPILSEDFTSPSDEWWTGTEPGESTSFSFGSLRTVLSDGPRSTWQWMELPVPMDAVSVEGTVTLDQGSGGGGVTCGPSDDIGHWLWGGFNSDGQWLLGRLVDGGLRVDARGELPLVRDPDAPVGGALPVALRLDCTADREGAEGRAALWTKGVRVGEVPVPGTGPFGKAGFLTAIDDGPLTILFDDLVVRDLPGDDATTP